MQTKSGERKRHISEVVRFFVNEGLGATKKNFLKKSEGDQISAIKKQANYLSSAIAVIRQFELSKSTIDWMAKKLLEDSKGKHSFTYSNYINSLIRLGASRSVVEKYLQLLIKFGFGVHASSVAKRYLKRNLTDNELKELIKKMEKSASHGSNDERNLVSIVKTNGHPEFEQEVKNAVVRKMKRWGEIDY